jgi:hypothetical protein
MSVVFLLAGCTTTVPERMDLLFDSHRQHLSLADRWAISKHLPYGLTLSTLIFPDEILEEELAKVGATLGENGKLHDRAGKEIYFDYGEPGGGPAPPPEDPEKILERQKEYEDLQAKYCVITIIAWWKPPIP